MVPHHSVCGGGPQICDVGVARTRGGGAHARTQARTQARMHAFTEKPDCSAGRASQAKCRVPPLTLPSAHLCVGVKPRAFQLIQLVVGRQGQHPRPIHKRQHQVRVLVSTVRPARRRARAVLGEGRPRPPACCTRDWHRSRRGGPYQRVPRPQNPLQRPGQPTCARSRCP